MSEAENATRESREFLNPSKYSWDAIRYCAIAFVAIGLLVAVVGVLLSALELIIVIVTESTKEADLQVELAQAISIAGTIVGCILAILAGSFLSTCRRVVLSSEGIEILRLSKRETIRWAELRSARYYRLPGLEESLELTIQDFYSPSPGNKHAIEIGFGKGKQKSVIRGAIENFEEIPFAIEHFSAGRVRFPNLKRPEKSA